MSSRGTLHKIKKKRILCEKYSQNHGVLNNFSYLCGNFVFFNMVIEHNYNVVPRELSELFMKGFFIKGSV